MKVQVKLPNVQLIDYQYFFNAIAEGICPASEIFFTGINCIVGKQIKVLGLIAVSACQDKLPSSSETIQSGVSFSKCSVTDQSHVNQCEVAQPSIQYPASDVMLDQQVEEFSLPYKLTDEDRRLMEKLLGDLPKLHYPLSEKDVTKFLEAYSAHPNRPAWEPLLVNAAHVEKLKAERHKAMVLHQKALLEELAIGRLTAVNANHIPAKTLAPGVFIPRKEAIAYLDRCGMSHGDFEFDDAFHSHIKISEVKPRTVGIPIFTVQKKKELVEFHRCLKGKKDRKPTAKTAEKFKTSTSTVRKFVRAAKKEEEDLKNAVSGAVKPR